jgi:hypothetical protein
LSSPKKSLLGTAHRRDRGQTPEIVAEPGSSDDVTIGFLERRLRHQAIR